MLKRVSPLPLIIAHRGASGLVPENTALAVAAAIVLGADMVEVDARLTRDGQLVIFHDPSLGRTARFSHHPSRVTRHGSIRIADMTLYEIGELDAGSWYDRDFAGLRIPTVMEILTLCAGRIALNLEVKVDREATLAIRKQIVAQLDRALRTQPRMWTSNSVLISSTDHPLLQLARNIMPKATLGLLAQADADGTAAWLSNTLRTADRLEAFSLHLPWPLVTPALMATLRSRRKKLRLFAYTVNSASRMHRLMTDGVDGLFTDHPERLLARLRSTV
ncbi:MAG: hypothetical protein EPO64_05165 [Nitrospirae bacterium]|nr:MAG: hypothetical protein EPO64_05165 [Nitrospirota bacterium]